MEGLRPHAHQKALRKLQDLEFGDADLESLRIDDEGDIYFVPFNFLPKSLLRIMFRVLLRGPGYPG